MLVKYHYSNQIFRSVTLINTTRSWRFMYLITGTFFPPDTYPKLYWDN